MVKIYNLKDTPLEEVIKTYKIVALKSQIPKEIWNKTGNYKDAMKVYREYILKRKHENND